MKKKYIQPYEFVFTLISFGCFVLLLKYSEWMRLNMPEPYFRAAAGFVIGTMSSFAFATLVSLVKRCLKGRRSSEKEGFWQRACTWFFYLFVLISGGIGWYVSWEGVTGVWYGLGFFVAALLVTYGVGSILTEEKVLH